MVLGDLGADVVKVEPPAGDETRRWGPPFLGDTAAYFYAANRNKRSVRLDLKTETGQGELRALMSRADVLVQNFTGDLARKLRVDVQSVRAVNPACIHVTLSGYGPQQPDRRGYDLMAQALGGLISVTGERGSHGVKVGVPVADLFAGMWAATAVTAALYARRSTGQASAIEVSLLDSVASLLANQAMSWLLCGRLPGPLGNDHPTVVPYGVFPTATDDIVVAVASDAQYRTLCEAIGRPDLAADPRFETNSGRVQNRAELERALADRLSTETAAAWTQRLNAAGIIVGPVRNVRDALASEDVGNVASVDHPRLGPIKQVLAPIRLDGEYLTPVLAPPELDEHHLDVLG